MKIVSLNYPNASWRARASRIKKYSRKKNFADTSSLFLRSPRGIKTPVYVSERVIHRKLVFLIVFYFDRVSQVLMIGRMEYSFW